MELHLLSSILWYESAAYQLSLYNQRDPGRALKCQGLSMKRLCALYILKLHFLEGFAISVQYGFTAATEALQTGCLRLVLLKSIPTLACLTYVCRAGRSVWVGGKVVVLSFGCQVGMFRNFVWLCPLSPLFLVVRISMWTLAAEGMRQQVTEEQEMMLLTLLPLVLVTSAEYTGVSVIKHTLFGSLLLILTGDLHYDLFFSNTCFQNTRDLFLCLFLLALDVTWYK